MRIVVIDDAPSCRRLLESGRLSPADIAYLRNKIRSASFLIQGIRRRDDTLRRVVELIVLFQRDYLEGGEGQLRPLTMAKIAAALRVHETTVSRALANKHVKTPRGVVPLKHFFQPGYRCTDGSALTPEAVKEIIAEAIDNEEPSNPIRDVDVGDMLKKRGLALARRTIAKYREELGIPSSKERRRLGPEACLKPKNGPVAVSTTPLPNQESPAITPTTELPCLNGTAPLASAVA